LSSQFQPILRGFSVVFFEDLQIIPNECLLYTNHCEPTTHGDGRITTKTRPDQGYRQVYFVFLSLALLNFACECLILAFFFLGCNNTTSCSSKSMFSFLTAPNSRNGHAMDHPMNPEEFHPGHSSTEDFFSPYLPRPRPLPRLSSRDLWPRDRIPEKAQAKFSLRGGEYILLSQSTNQLHIAG
jgi:hypothetical protein